MRCLLKVMIHVLVAVVSAWAVTTAPPPRHSLHCSVTNVRAENHSRLRAVCSEPMLTAILDFMSVMGLAVLRVLNSLYLVREAGQDKLEIPELWNSQRFKGRWAEEEVLYGCLRFLGSKRKTFWQIELSSSWHTGIGQVGKTSFQEEAPLRRAFSLFIA